MESTQVLLSAFILLSSWIVVGFAISLDDLSSLGGAGAAAAASASASGDSFPCVKKLLPCQPYLEDPSSPPLSCCLPLKEMVVNDAQCLCHIFNSPNFLKTLNVTQGQALKLPKACGANADITRCKEGATSPSNMLTTPPPSANSNSGSTSGAYYFGGYVFIYLLSSLLCLSL